MNPHKLRSARLALKTAREYLQSSTQSGIPSTLVGELLNVRAALSDALDAMDILAEEPAIFGEPRRHERVEVAERALDIAEDLINRALAHLLAHGLNETALYIARNVFVSRRVGVEPIKARCDTCNVNGWCGASGSDCSCDCHEAIVHFAHCANKPFEACCGADANQKMTQIRENVTCVACRTSRHML